MLMKALRWFALWLGWPLSIALIVFDVGPLQPVLWVVALCSVHQNGRILENRRMIRAIYLAELQRQTAEELRRIARR